MSKLTDWVDSSPERQRLFAEEQLIASASEEIWAAMETARVNKAGLAQLLGKSKAHVTQLLNGSRNMTLRTLAGIAHTLGVTARISFQENDHNDDGKWYALQSVSRVRAPTYLRGIEYLTNDEWVSVETRSDQEAA